MCQVVEGPFIKSGFSSLLRRVDINIKIGSRNDFLTKHDDFLIKCLHFLKNKSTKRQGCVPSAKIQFSKTTFKKKCPKLSFSLKMIKNMTLYEKRSKNMILLVPYIPLAPKIPIESGSNLNLEPPPPVRTSDRYAKGYTTDETPGGFKEFEVSCQPTGEVSGIYREIL